MSDDDELELNTIARFRKGSLRLVLEEHGHCEVPAGCGGVVLRWTDPRGGIPVRLWIYSAGEVSVQIDGEAPTSSRPVLSYGTHELTLEVVPPFLFAAASDEHLEGRAPRGLPPPERMLLISRADGRWEYQTGAAWSPLERCEVPAPERYSRGSHAYQELTELGASGLAPPSADATPIRVRRTFEVRRP